MIFAELRSVAFAVWAAIHPLAPRAPDADAIADGLAAAVETDDAPPLTGTRLGDAALAAVYAYRESGLRRCPPPGDAGRSWGAWQLQGLPAAVACDPVQAAPRWLAMAHRSAQMCAGLPTEDGLAALVSGSCSRGRRLARWRWEQAARLALPFLEEKG